MLNTNDRSAIEGLFDRLAEAERKSAPRDGDAEALIRQKMAAQPSAPYYLAQTVIVQQEALKAAERKIEELEGRASRAVDAPRRGPWGSVNAADAGRYGQGMAYGSGGFLAGAAQTALGVAGGVLLGNMIGSLFGAGTANAAEAGGGESSGDAGSDHDNGNDATDGGNDAGGGGDDGFDMGGDF